MAQRELKIVPSLLAIACVCSLAACSSSGGMRVASVGGTGNGTTTPVDDGNGGAGGPGTPVDGDPSGNPSQPGQMQNSSFLSQLPIGPVTGDRGVIGTGLLANVGASEPGVISPLLAQSGNAVLSVSTGIDTATASLGLAPQDGGLGGVIGTVLTATTGVGEALVNAGQGTAPLLDGIVSATAPSLNSVNTNIVAPLAGVTSPITSSASPLINISVGGHDFVGSGGPSVIGVGILTPTQTIGTGATVGVVSDGDLLTAAVPGITNGLAALSGNTAANPVAGSGSAITDGVSNLLAPVVNSVTSSLGSPGTSSNLTGSVSSVLGGLTGSPTASSSPSTTTLGGLGGLLGR